MNNINKVTDPLFYDYEEDVWQDIMGDDAVAAAPNNVLMPALEAQTFVETKPLQEREGFVWLGAPVAVPEKEDNEAIVLQLRAKVDQCQRDMEQADHIMWGVNMACRVLSDEDLKDHDFLRKEFLPHIVKVNEEVIKYQAIMDDIWCCSIKEVIDEEVKSSLQSKIVPLFKNIKRKFLNFALVLMEAGVHGAEDGVIFGVETEIVSPRFREKSYESFRQMIISICEDGNRVLRQFISEVREGIIFNPSLFPQTKCSFLEKILKIMSAVRAESSEDDNQIYTELVEQGVDIPPFLERAARMYARFKSLMNSCWGEMDYVESHLLILDRIVGKALKVVDEFVEDEDVFIWEQSWYENGMNKEFPGCLKTLERSSKRFVKEIQKSLDKIKQETKEMEALEKGMSQLSLQK